MKINKFLAIILSIICIISISTITTLAHEESTYNAWYGGEAYYIDEYNLGYIWDDIAGIPDKIFESLGITREWNILIDKTGNGDYYYIEQVWWDEDIEEYIFDAYSITDGFATEEQFISGEMPPPIITYKMMMAYDLYYEDSIPWEEEIYIGGIKDTTKIIYSNTAEYIKRLNTNLFKSYIYGEERISFLGYFIIISFGIIIIAKIFKLITNTIRRGI